MDDTSNDSYEIGTTVGDGTSQGTTVKAGADSAVGTNPVTNVKGSTGPDTIKVRVGTGALYTDPTTNSVTDVSRVTSAGNSGSAVLHNADDTTCQDCLNNVTIGVAGDGYSTFARRETNTFLFKSIRSEGAISLRQDGNTIFIGGSAAVPALDVVLGSKGDLSAYANKYLSVNNTGDGVAFVDGPSSAGVSKFSELTDVPVTAGNGGKVLTVNSNGVGVTWSNVSWTNLINKPTLFSGSYTDLTNKPTFFSGAYADLTGKPALFSGNYADLTGRPVLFDGKYSSLTGAPTLVTKFTDLTDAPALAGNSGKVLSVNSAGTGIEWATVSSGSVTWNSITGKPTFFSGSYADLTGKPTLFDGAYASLTGKPTLFNGLFSSLTDVPAATGNANKVLAVNSTGNGYTWVAQSSGTGGASKFTDLTDAPAFTNNQSKYLRLNSAGAALEFATIAYSDLTGKPTLATVATSGLYADLVGKPTYALVATSGSYGDLVNKPTIPAKLVDLSDVPAVSGNANKVLAVNSAGTGFAWVAQSAGGSGGGASSFTQLSDAPQSYTGQALKYTRVNSGATGLEFVTPSYNDLSDKPTIPAAVTKTSQLTNDSGFLTSAPVSSVAGRTGAVTLTTTDIGGLATVAKTGGYADLINKPTLVTALTGLSDVAVASPTTGQVLTYNGTKWVNQTPAASGGSGNTGGGGSANTIYSFTVTFDSAGKWLSVDNLPSGWSAAIDSGKAFAIITKADTGVIKTVSGWGNTAGEMKMFAFGSAFAYTSYNVNTLNMFKLYLTSMSSLSTVNGGSVLIQMTI